MALVILDAGRGESPAQDSRLREQGRPGGYATALQPMDYTLGRVNYSSSPGQYEIRQGTLAISTYSYIIHVLVHI